MQPYSFLSGHSKPLFIPASKWVPIFDRIRDHSMREAISMRENRTLKKLKNTVVYTGEQVKQVAKEVAEDCDNEVLRNARSFYGGIARKTKRRVSNKVKEAQSAAEEKRKEMLQTQQQRAKERHGMVKRATIILICMIVIAMLLMSFAFWVGHRI